MRTYNIEHITAGPLVPHFRVVVIDEEGEAAVLEENFQTREEAQRAINSLRKADDAGDTA